VLLPPLKQNYLYSLRFVCTFCSQGRWQSNRHYFTASFSWFPAWLDLQYWI
jgi:hypothetical protein